MWDVENDRHFGNMQHGMSTKLSAGGTLAFPCQSMSAWSPALPAGLHFFKKYIDCIAKVSLRCFRVEKRAGLTARIQTRRANHLIKGFVRIGFLLYERPCLEPQGSPDSCLAGLSTCVVARPFERVSRGQSYKRSRTHASAKIPQTSRRKN